MRRKYMWWLIAVVAVVLLGAALWGPIVSNVEQPKYQVVESSGNIEIRDYTPMIVAEAEVSGDRPNAIGKGFRIIADYIFGNNTTAQKVPMTAPSGASRGTFVVDIHLTRPSGQGCSSSLLTAGWPVVITSCSSARYCMARWSSK